MGIALYKNLSCQPLQFSSKWLVNKCPTILSNDEVCLDKIKPELITWTKHPKAATWINIYTNFFLPFIVSDPPILYHVQAKLKISQPISLD